MALRARNASSWLRSTLTPRSTDLGLGPDLRCGVRAGSLRAPEPRVRAEILGRKGKKADVEKKQMYSVGRLASEGFTRGYSKSVCVRMPSENFEPTRLFSHTTPDAHPPTPPPRRWPARITCRIPTKFQLVWRRLYNQCDDVLFRSPCFFERTLCATGRSEYSLIWYTFVDFVTINELGDGPSSSLVLLPCLRLTPRRHCQADDQISPLYAPPCQVSTGLVPLV